MSFFSYYETFMRLVTLGLCTWIIYAFFNNVSGLQDFFWHEIVGVQSHSSTTESSSPPPSRTSGLPRHHRRALSRPRTPLPREELVPDFLFAKATTPLPLQTPWVIKERCRLALDPDFQEYWGLAKAVYVYGSWRFVTMSEEEQAERRVIRAVDKDQQNQQFWRFQASKPSTSSDCSGPHSRTAAMYTSSFSPVSSPLARAPSPAPVPTSPRPRVAAVSASPTPSLPDWSPSFVGGGRTHEDWLASLTFTLHDPEPLTLDNPAPALAPSPPRSPIAPSPAPALIPTPTPATNSTSPQSWMINQFSEVVARTGGDKPCFEIDPIRWQLSPRRPAPKSPFDDFSEKCQKSAHLPLVFPERFWTLTAASPARVPPPTSVPPPCPLLPLRPYLLLRPRPLLLLLLLRPTPARTSAL